ncbi:MAG: hypothetical protein HQ553_05450 [Chloroflexi bacterium]|nr:hypothetical protein [Chloroflexota bacterium]
MWLSLEEASKELKVEKRRIRELLKNEKLEGHFTGAVGWIIDKESVDSYKINKNIGGRPKKPKRPYHRKHQPEQTIDTTSPSDSHQPRLQEKEETKEKERGI